MNYFESLYREIAEQVQQTEGGLAAYLEEAKQGPPDYLIDNTLKPLELALEGGAETVPKWLPSAMGDMFDRMAANDRDGVKAKWREIKGLLNISQ